VNNISVVDIFSQVESTADYQGQGDSRHTEKSDPKTRL